MESMSESRAVSNIADRSLPITQHTAGVYETAVLLARAKLATSATATIISTLVALVSAAVRLRGWDPALAWPVAHAAPETSSSSRADASARETRCSRSDNSGASARHRNSSDDQIFSFHRKLLLPG